MWSNVTRFYPLWVIVPYILIGVLSSIWGAFEYAGYDKNSVLLYIGAFLILFSFGYSIGVHSGLPVNRDLSLQEKKQIVGGLFRFCAVISFVYLSFEFAMALFSGNLNINLTTTGSAYINSYEGLSRNSGNYSIRFLISSLAALPMFVCVVWGVFYFKKLELIWKIVVIYVIVMTIAVFTVGTGKQKQLGDLMIYLFAIWGIKMASESRVKLKNVLAIAAVMLVGVGLMLTLLGSRYAAIGVNSDTINEGIHALIYFKQDSYIMKLFGQNLGFAISMLSGYLGQGYYGLSLAMEQDFTWTAFGGSSYSFSVILNQLFGFPFLVEQSYPYLVGDNTGWAETKWHSVFAWFASDFTFPGTLVLFTFVAFIYGRTWKEAVSNGNPFSVLLFCLLSVGIIYIPANNQLMHSPGGLFTLIGIVALYFLFRASFNEPVEDYEAVEVAAS